MPQTIRDVAALGASDHVLLVVGTKMTGDAHVVMQQVSFVAMAHPQRMPAAENTAEDERLTSIQDRQTGVREEILCQWRGWGTLAYPGFNAPSFNEGRLLQLTNGQSGSQRFGFYWLRSRNQDAVVLHWLKAQDRHHFDERGMGHAVRHSA